MLGAARWALMGRSIVQAALAWEKAVIAAGGTVSPSQLARVSLLIRRQIANGAWALTDDQWLLAAENSTQALVSLKQARTATVTAAPTFTAFRSYAFDGATNYIDTGFIPSSHAVAMAVATQRIATYERTDVLGVTTSAGTSQGTGQRIIEIRPRATANAFGGTIGTAAAQNVGTAVDSLALSSFASDATTQSGYKRGVFTGSTTPSITETVLPNTSIWIGGCNVAGVLTRPRATTIAFASIGALLSAAQELSTYNAVQSYMASVGASV